MTSIPNVEDKVPMMYRAQIDGRCQLHRLVQGAKEQDAKIWVDEWIERTYPNAPSFSDSDSMRSRTYKLSWRFVTNAGQDDDIIRPVIGAKGWPFYPGSSMKGLFRSACTPAQRDRYCGRELPSGDMEPGILRFLGGYPTSDAWRDKLLDLVHPQQDYQVKDGRAKHSAFMLISLYQPELQFGISSSQSLSEEEWKEIWGIWERALGKGIGSRVCAGYGHPAETEIKGDELYSPHFLKGQGMASKLLDGTGEFRPNMFRAAIRGHALRIFGGLTDAMTAEREVGKIFGDLGQREPIVGLLGMKFVTDDLQMGRQGQGSYAVPTYNIKGKLSWLLARSLQDEQREALKKLILHLNQFAMVLGGFGKSWRRADHCMFFEEYCETPSKPYIGCHWQWLGQKTSLLRDVKVRSLDKLAKFIDDTREAARTWLTLQGVQLTTDYAREWREAWHPGKVQVWGHLAEGREDSAAIEWFHSPYRNGDRCAGIAEGSIYKSSLTGKLGNIGRTWHRMYPLVRLVKDPETQKQVPKPTSKYLEFLTFFPDDSRECRAFIAYLQQEQNDFQRLWPNP